MKKLTVVFLGICLGTMLLSGCTKEIEPDNYICLNAGRLYNPEGYKKLRALQDEGKIENAEVFAMKCREKQMGVYNPAYADINRKFMAAKLRGLKHQQAQLQSELDMLKEQFKKEVGAKD